MDPAGAQLYAERIQAQELLAVVRFPDITNALLASSIGLAIQALLTGSCLQLVRTYLRTRNDRLLARVAIGWIVLLLLVCVALANMQQAMLVVHRDRFTAWQFQDFWFHRLQLLLAATLYAPILIFYLRRAYHIWEKSKVVLYIGYTLVAISFAMSIVACAFGLRLPEGGFALRTNEQYAQGLRTYRSYMSSFQYFAKTSVVVQFITRTSVCFLTCYGIYRHRNGYKAFDSAVSRVAFISGESLIPLAILTLVNFLLPTVRGLTTTSTLLRERILRVMQADPVRHLATLPDSPTIGVDVALVDLNFIGHNNGAEQDHKKDKEVISLVSPAGAQTRTWPELRAQSSVLARLMLRTPEEIFSSPGMSTSWSDGDNWLETALQTPSTAYIRNNSGTADPRRGEAASLVSHFVPPPGDGSPDKRKTGGCLEDMAEDAEEGLDFMDMLRDGPPTAKKN